MSDLRLPEPGAGCTGTVVHVPDVLLLDQMNISVVIIRKGKGEKAVLVLWLLGYIIPPDPTKAAFGSRLALWNRAHKEHPSMRVLSAHVRTS